MRLNDLIVVRDRRGNGLVTYYGPFRAPAAAQARVEAINKAARSDRAPKLENGDPAIAAGLAWLRSGRDATLERTVFDAPDPEDLIRPSERKASAPTP